MDKNEFPFKISFSSIVKPIVAEETDRFLAKASLTELAKYIPDIDTTTNIDLLPIAFNAFVANRFNNNDDGCDGETAVAIARFFKNKPINLEHHRDKVMGVITNFAFTQFGSNESMTEAEALACKEPFNVALGGILWRIVNPKMAKIIEASSDPASESYLTISASWELGFLEFAIAKVEGESRNMEDATVVTDPTELKQLEGYLKAFGGKGRYKDERLYRVVKGSALPLGIGLTQNPAAEVEGIATSKTKETETAKAEIQGSTASEEVITAKVEENQEKISQDEKNIVIQEREIVMSVKINKLEDITDAVLKQASASDLTQWMKDQFKLAEEAYLTDKNKLSDEIKASKEAYDKLVTEQNKLNETLKSVNASLETLTKEKEARAKQDTFNSRMTELDSDFELGDAEREIIASDITNLDDAAFTAYKKKLDVLLAAKKKSKESIKKQKANPTSENQKSGPDDGKDTGNVPAPFKKKAKADDDGDDDDEAAAKLKESKASTAAATEVVDTAIENAKPDAAKLPAAIKASEPTTMDKFAKAFGVENWISDVKLTD